MKTKLISIVVPCYNEANNVPELYDRVKSVFNSLPYDFELVLVDNRSTDQSLEIYNHLISEDDRVRVVLMSRNFGGPQPSYFAGLQEARGDAAVLLDADLQDPPELIKDFVGLWEKGYQVVYGVRETRDETLIRRVGYRLFYRILQGLSSVPIPLDAGEFSLIDRRVIDVMTSLPEKDIWIRGLRAWAGFRQTGILYHRPDRKRGKTTFSFWGYVRAAKNAIVNFSHKPLEYISSLAIGSAIVTSITACVYLYLSFTHKAPQGFFTLVLAMLFFGTLQLVALGVIAEYLIRIFREVKSRPPYVIDRILGQKKER